MRTLFLLFSLSLIACPEPDEAPFSRDCADEDNDGFCRVDDCDDLDPAANPDAEEVCDGVDTDCDGDLPADEVDADGDGFQPCSGDCDEGAAAVNPQGFDTIGGGDGNCDGVEGGLNPSHGDIPGSEADLRQFMLEHCAQRGLVPLAVGFEGGEAEDPLDEVTVDITASADEPVSMVYAEEAGLLSAFAGELFAVAEVPATQVSLRFDRPQTGVALAIGGYDTPIWQDYAVQLMWEGELVAPGNVFSGVQPEGDWAFRGWLTLDWVAFDQIIISGPETSALGFDEIVVCAPEE